ncbi:MAG: hypothetical protein QM500_19565 [Methylococcales bacterium]
MIENQKFEDQLIRLEKPRPKTSFYSYSYPASQGALICETVGFPDKCLSSEHKIAYSDRICGWDYDRFQKACEIAGTGDQGWSSALPKLNETTLKHFAQVALKLDAEPKHVRVVHHFNMSNGYSCPTVEAVC